MGRVPCCEKDNVKRGQWTPEEDNKLLSYITQYGTRNWRLIPKNAGTYVATAGQRAFPLMNRLCMSARCVFVRI